MTVNVFQPFETGLPSDDEMIERLQQQNELLGQAIMPLYAGLGPQLDDQQDAIDLARRRLAERVKLQQKKTAKILEPVTGQLHDYAASALGEQQGMIDMSAARAGAAAATAGVTYPASPLPALVPTVQPQPQNAPIVSAMSPNFYGDSWLSFFRCADGSAAAAKVGDDNSINSLTSSGYTQVSVGPWPDIYAATGWFQTTAGVDWIKANCGSVYIPPPIGPPPPPEGPPPPPDPTSPTGYWLVRYTCTPPQVTLVAEGSVADSALKTGGWLIADDIRYTFQADAQDWIDNESQNWLATECGGVVPIGTPPPPGCCPPWDLMPYIDKLCKCIKHASSHGNADLDQPLLFLFDESGEAWRQRAINFSGPELGRMAAAESLESLEQSSLGGSSKRVDYANPWSVTGSGKG